MYVEECNCKKFSHTQARARFFDRIMIHHTAYKRPVAMLAVNNHVNPFGFLVTSLF